MMDARSLFAKWFAPRLAVTVFALLCAFTATPARAALSFVQNFGSAGSGSGQFSGPTVSPWTARGMSMSPTQQQPDRPFQSGKLRGHLHLLRQCRVRQRAV